MGPPKNFQYVFFLNLGKYVIAERSNKFLSFYFVVVCFGGYCVDPEALTLNILYVP